MNWLKKIFDTFATVILSFILTVLALSGVFIWLKYPQFKLFIVRSGSMNPNIPIGSIILVDSVKKPLDIISPLIQPTYNPGETVTFKKYSSVVTHRITQAENINGEYFYKTQGDANKGEDLEKITEDQIVGRVAFAWSNLGFGINFIKTQKGYWMFALIPLILLFLNEMNSLIREIKKLILNNKKTI